ncbi:unnamed protein product [Moneuplotes crassus]|uniref:Uncharacterized protein n=1 Tax=Euplotes crassus TaxID=5936 RepID=A0AAD1XZZ2_EUPCR|nr:unnamed protein product [Moneuplotes crassus]
MTKTRSYSLLNALTKYSFISICSTALNINLALSNFLPDSRHKSLARDVTVVT